MDEVLGKRILGACVLVLVALVLSSLLPQPHALPPAGEKRVVYDLRQLNTAQPAPVPVPAAPEEPAPSPKPTPSVAEAQTSPPKSPPKNSIVQEPSPSPVAEAAHPARPTVPPPVASAPEKAVPIESSWYIQIGAFAQEGNAQLSMKRLRDAGLHPRTDVLGAAATKRYRVRCGPYSSRKQALQQQARVAKLGFADARVTSDAR